MDCLFCKIISNDISAYKIYEDNLVLAFLDINQDAPGHTLIVPKKHHADYLELDKDLFNHIIEVAKKINDDIFKKLKAEGSSFVWNYGISQEIKHFHLHILPKYKNKPVLKDEEIFNILTK